ncbi:hypothetical protein LTR56_014174 [Elasticomyces elasticus]|nr:hypothetical protein LTR56_014174 [Elasticomyces elasticus]KAK3662782.1 hypothetical protein LTR22_006398 [Elasticomyces elasticus]KAK4917994.1 hypothetical protein LTR49_014132 [Elasticomyces elasticus]KAK5736877.1 hypothetical protein LTS12_026046 [Elasticomyces elasticus]
MAGLPPLIAYETLLWLGLNHERADQIWERWKQITPIDDDDPHYDNESLGLFAKDFLRNLVNYDEGCDIYGDIDWTPNLRRIGANEELIDAIVNSEYRSIQLSQSTLDWVMKAMEWRWEYLVHVYEQQINEEASESDSDDKSGSRVELGNAGCLLLSTPAQGLDGGEEKAADETTAHSGIPITIQADNATSFTYDHGTNTAVNAAGEHLDYIPLWRATTRINAEKMWSKPQRTGTFSIRTQSTNRPTDFSGNRALQYWTPNLEAAQLYAGFAERIAGPAGVCLIRIEVAAKLMEQGQVTVLRCKDEEWKRLVWSSRRGQKVDGKELWRMLAKTWLIVGDAATGANARYQKMDDWRQVDERCLLRLKNGQPVTQFVFGFSDFDDDLDDEIGKLGSGKVTIRHHECPNSVLAPMDLLESAGQ